MGYYSSGWSLVLIGLAEAIVFPWVYGAKKLKADIEYMVGFELGPHWWICWMFITPTLLIVRFRLIFVFVLMILFYTNMRLASLSATLRLSSYFFLSLKAILIFNIIDFTPLAFGDYVMPTWAQVLGWMMAVCSVAMIIIFALYHICNSYRDSDYDGMTLTQVIKHTCPCAIKYQYCTMYND